MAKLTLQMPFDSYTGKHNQKSNSYVMNRYGTLCTVAIGQRNYQLHPKTSDERTNQQHMAQASQEYNAIDRLGPQWQQLCQAWEAQKNGGYHSIRSYYIGTRLRQLKSQV